MEHIFDLGPGFWAMAPNVPKMAQNTKIVTHHTGFQLGSSSPRIMLTYPGTKNSWNRFLIRAPVFVRTQIRQNTKILTTPTVFELGSSSFRIMMTYPRAKNSWIRFFIWAQFLGYGPKHAQNGPKH